MGKPISQSERIIMEVLWQEAPLTAGQIVSKVKIQSPWSDKTIRTFIQRLKEKGAITAKKMDVYYYWPSFTKEEVIATEAKSVLTKLYEGSLKKLLTNFLSDDDYTESDIEELQSHLEKLKKGRGHNE